MPRCQRAWLAWLLAAAALPLASRAGSGASLAHAPAPAAGVHPYMQGAADEGGPLWLPYRKSRAECYRRSRPRVHDTVVTILLPHQSNKTMPAIHGGGLANLLLNTPADVVFFHTGWTQADLQRLRGEVSFEFEALCIANADWQDDIEAQDWEFVQQAFQGLGYRSMCRWYSRRVFAVLHRMGYRWMIRLDDDSIIPRPIPYNLVAAMERRGAQYGFRGDDLEHWAALIGLTDAVRFWVQAQRLPAGKGFILDSCKPRSLDGLVSGFNKMIIYNNFFITNTTWWMQPHVQGALRYLESLNGFHKLRWGDAPVHTLLTGFLLPREAMLQYADWEYSHQHRTFAVGNASTFAVPRHHEAAEAAAGDAVV